MTLGGLSLFGSNESSVLRLETASSPTLYIPDASLVESGRCKVERVDWLTVFPLFTCPLPPAVKLIGRLPYEAASNNCPSRAVLATFPI
jgi:hypothetical protein